MPRSTTRNPRDKPEPSSSLRSILNADRSGLIFSRSILDSILATHRRANSRVVDSAVRSIINAERYPRQSLEQEH